MVKGRSDRSGACGTGSVTGTYENRPARNPFNHARCSAVNGADSGMTGTHRNGGRETVAAPGREAGRSTPDPSGSVDPIHADSDFPPGVPAIATAPGF